jgi:hypothetical protein
MSKLYQVLPRGFFCLVAVLLVLSALAMPSRDAHSDEPIACGPGNGSNTDCPDGYVCDGQYCVPQAQCSGAVCDQGAPSGCAADCDVDSVCINKKSQPSQLCTDYMCQKGTNCDPCACKYVKGKITCQCITKWYLFSASKRLYRYTAQVEWMKFLEN